MSRVFLTLVLAVIGMMFLATDTLHAQDDCERVLQGNPLSPCKQLDYLDGVQPPELRVEAYYDEQQDLYCAPVAFFPLSEPIDTGLVSTDKNFPVFWHHIDSGGYWSDPGNMAQYHVKDIIVESGIALPIGNRGQWFRVYPDRRANFTGFEGGVLNPSGRGVVIGVHLEGYTVYSHPLHAHASFNDYQALLKDCLLKIQRHQEQADADEQARQEKVRLELAEAQLAEEERHQATLLRTTLDSIKTEQAIRKTWQVFTTTRIAGLEERTNLWHQAVQRWNEESLQFSAEMQERIDKVTERQETILALRQAMADRQDSLDAQITALEKQLEDLETPSP